MKKRLIGALLCLMMVLSLFPTTAFADDETPEPNAGDTTETGTLTIQKTVDGSITLEKDTDFTFTIKSTDESIEAKTVTVTVDHTKKTGETVVSGLPFGAYTITEDTDTAHLDGYALAASEPQTAALTKEKPSAAVSFTNTYSRQYGLDVAVIKNVVKTDTSDAPGDAAFTFKAYLDKQEVGTLTVQSTGVSRYEGKLPITLTDSQIGKKTVKLTVKEASDPAEGWTYDEAAYTLTVALKDGQLTVKSIRKDGKTYDAAKALEFTNTFDFRADEHHLNINITKNVVKAKGSNAPHAAEFTFKAYLDNQVVGSAVIKTNGVNSYAGKLAVTLTDKQLENGPVKLTVSEEKATSSAWASDASVYTLTVALVDGQLQITDIRKSGSDTSYGQGDKSLEFTNTYSKKSSNNNTPDPKPDDPKKPDSPKTGDTGIILYAATALTALGGGVMLVTRKRRTAR